MATSERALDRIGSSSCKYVYWAQYSCASGMRQASHALGYEEVHAAADCSEILREASALHKPAQACALFCATTEYFSTDDEGACHCCTRLSSDEVCAGVRGS